MEPRLALLLVLDLGVCGAVLTAELGNVTAFDGAADEERSPKIHYNCYYQVRLARANLFAEHRTQQTFAKWQVREKYYVQARPCRAVLLHFYYYVQSKEWFVALRATARVDQRGRSVQ